MTNACVSEEKKENKEEVIISLIKDIIETVFIFKR